MSERFEITRGPNPKEALAENVVLIEKDHARYRIIYGTHNHEQSAEAMANADCLVLESGTEGQYDTPEQATNLISECSVKVPQFRDLISNVAQHKKPIFFIDVQKAGITTLVQSVLRTVEIYAGFKILKSFAKEIISDKPVTRREFLKRSTAGIAGIYFFAHVPTTLSSVGGHPNEQSMRRSINRFLVDLDEQVHPETENILLTLRNYVIAQKLETVAKSMQKEGDPKPEIALICGSSHTGIEKAFSKSSDERIAVINALLSTPGLDETKKRIATIARLDFDGKEGKWTASIFKDPVLSHSEGT